MAVKTGISKLYAHARDRNYTSIYTKQGRTDRGLKSSRNLRNFESGSNALRWQSPSRYSIYATTSSTVYDKVGEKIRVSIVRALGAMMSKAQYLLRFPVIPHQILRSHALATGSKASRISKGMKLSFGKGFALASKLKPGQRYIQVYIDPSAKLDKTVDLKIKTFLKNLLSCLPFGAYVIKQVNNFVKENSNIKLETSPILATDNL